MLQKEWLKQGNLGTFRHIIQRTDACKHLHHALGHLAAHHVVLGDEGQGIALLKEENLLQMLSMARSESAEPDDQ